MTEYTSHKDGIINALRALMSIAIAGGVLSVGFGVHTFFFNSHNSSERTGYSQGEIEKEFRAIPPPPAAKKVDHYDSPSNDHALIVEKFSATLSYQEIQRHYKNELARQGWREIKEDVLYNWGSDGGGKIVYFRKGGYIAEMEYEGDPSDAGYTYAFSLSWGLRDL